MPYLPETFLAVVWLNSLLVAAGGLLLGGLALAALHLVGRPVSPLAYAIVAVLPLLVGVCAYALQLAYPAARAGARRKAIDLDLAYAANYTAAMSSAGVVPLAIFRDLARQPLYGEVSREVAWLVRDVDLLGMDLMGAIQRSVARSPSARYQDFMQGAKIAVLSGGDLRVYFVEKAEQYMAENRRLQKEFLDGLALFAESYVTIVVAAPLFMLVLLSVMAVIGRSAASTELFLFGLIFAMLPASHAAFSWLIANLTPEADA